MDISLLIENFKRFSESQSVRGTPDILSLYPGLVVEADLEYFMVLPESEGLLDSEYNVHRFDSLKTERRRVKLVPEKDMPGKIGLLLADFEVVYPDITFLEGFIVVSAIHGPLNFFMQKGAGKPNILNKFSKWSKSWNFYEVNFDQKEFQKIFSVYSPSYHEFKDANYARGAVTQNGACVISLDEEGHRKRAFIQNLKSWANVIKKMLDSPPRSKDWVQVHKQSLDQLGKMIGILGDE